MEKPLFEFYRCFNCKRPIEQRKLLKDHQCECGTRKIVPTHLTFFELWFYILTHYECIKLIFGEFRGKN